MSISRMKFLVRRWKKTKKSVKKACSQDLIVGISKEDSDLGNKTSKATEELEAKLDFIQK